MANIFRQAEAKVWAGPGSGRPCAVCQQPIDAADVEYELEDASDATVCIHVSCYLRRRSACASSRSACQARPRSA